MWVFLCVGTKIKAASPGSFAPRRFFFRSAGVFLSPKISAPEAKKITPAAGVSNARRRRLHKIKKSLRY
jgi:hypothetical protein